MCGTFLETLKRLFKRENVGDFASPRSVMKESYQQNLIDDGEAWLDMLKDKNLT